MPIYEFYCSDCHTLFSFLSRSVSSKQPSCPRCRRPRLERTASAFAISKGRPEPLADGTASELDETRMESVMGELAQDVEKIDEDNPRQMAGFLRKFFDRTGMPLGPSVQEAIRRMEAGEDPDRIEEEMGDQLAGEEAQLLTGGSGGLKQLERKLRPPNVDKTLYEL